jgi:hypothetical protein
MEYELIVETGESPVQPGIVSPASPIKRSNL